MSGVIPQGKAQVYSFKVPERRSRPRLSLALPECLPRARPHLASSRSYCEDTLVVRVHSEILASRRSSPPDGKTSGEAALRGHPQREQYLARNGSPSAKFYLHVSKPERRSASSSASTSRRRRSSLRRREGARLLEGLRCGFEDVVANTATKFGAVYVVPADNKCSPTSFWPPGCSTRWRGSTSTSEVRRESSSNLLRRSEPYSRRVRTLAVGMAMGDGSRVARSRSSWREVFLWTAHNLPCGGGC